jgi:hypothetical protein
MGGRHFGGGEESEGGGEKSGGEEGFHGGILAWRWIGREKHEARKGKRATKAKAKGKGQKAKGKRQKGGALRGLYLLGGL